MKLQGVPNCGLGSVNMPIDQGCQGYGPIVRYIRPTGDKGRIFFFFNAIFLFLLNFQWNPSVGLLLLLASAAEVLVVLTVD